MATILFQGPVLGQVVRVVDFGTGANPRLAVEAEQQPDAMGSKGWSGMGSLSVEQLAALLIAAGVLH